MADWNTNPEGYLKDSKGAFILKKDGTPKKKAGRKAGPLSVPYNFSKAQLLKQAETKKLALKRKEKRKLENRRNARLANEAKKIESLKKDIEAGKEKVAVLKGKSPSQIIDGLDPERLEDSDVLFAANPGPQTEFLACNAVDVLYGGSAGGGKSYAMLVDPLRFAHRPTARALLLRRSMPELRELIDKSRELFPKAFPGAKYREVEKIWTFPSGAKFEFGFLERDADVYRYQGQAFTWIGFDEITQMATEFSWNYLGSRLRTTDPAITCYMRCTANPGGIGAHWVKKRYIDPSEPNKTFEVRINDSVITRRFIPARLTDNPYLTQDNQYMNMLQALPPVLRKQLLEGDWDVAEGAAFTEFDYLKHVVDPFEIPLHWERIKGIDYGYASESAVVWGAIDPSDGTLILYRELYRKGMTAKQLGEVMIEMERGDIMSIQGVIDTQCFARTGHTGPTQAEEIIRLGHKLRRADKNRIAGKIQVHEYLKVQHSGRPKIQIFSSCPNTIRELQTIPLSKSNPEDVDTHAADHAYDALRYLIMSRPRMMDPRSQMSNYKRDMPYQPSDSTFGY